MIDYGWGFLPIMDGLFYPNSYFVEGGGHGAGPVVEVP